MSFSKTSYAASDVNSPAELVAKYGDVRISWAEGNSYPAKQRAGLWPYVAYGWATYLERARIREISQGESE